MTANAPPNAVNSPLTISAGDADLGLRDVEMRMRSLTGISDDTAGPAQEAVCYHLESGGRRTRAVIGLQAAHALGIQQLDSVALAACAELLHNASLIHDDLQDRSLQRRDRGAVWFKFGEAIAICAGDLLVSAAYASLVAVTDKEKLGRLVAATHAATAVVITGQAKDLSLQNTYLADFDVYRQVAGAKSGPLLGLPLEFTLIAADHTEYCNVARSVATDLAIAYQIADDLADQEADAGGEAQPRCLNAVAVLRNSGCNQPEAVARNEALAALRKASGAASTLPRRSGSPFLRCLEEIDAKLASAMP